LIASIKEEGKGADHREILKDNKEILKKL